MPARVRGVTDVGYGVQRERPRVSAGAKRVITEGRIVRRNGPVLQRRVRRLTGVKPRVNLDDRCVYA